jgi:hypothetical protein
MRSRPNNQIGIEMFRVLANPTSLRSIASVSTALPAETLKKIKGIFRIKNDVAPVIWTTFHPLRALAVFHFFIAEFLLFLF